MDLSSIYPDDSGNVFDSMVESMDSLFIVHTNHVDQLAKQLATYHTFTGRVAYYWHQDSGIKRFDLQHITLPKTNQFTDALYHVANMPQFGIFLFSGFDKALHSPLIPNLIAHFLESTKQHRKYIIFAGQAPQIPKGLQEKCQILTIKSNNVATEPPVRTSYLYS